MITTDEFWMNMAYLCAENSKDESTHIGAVIVGPDNEIRSVGWNGFPRGINDNLQHRQERPEKYYWFAHAERNSTYNAARIGVSVKDCVMYTPGIPCSDCAIAIIQSGIKEVILDKDWDEGNSEKWSESGNRSHQMFEEAGVSVRFLENFDTIKPRKFKRGKSL